MVKSMRFCNCIPTGAFQEGEGGADKRDKRERGKGEREREIEQVGVANSGNKDAGKLVKVRCAPTRSSIPC